MKARYVLWMILAALPAAAQTDETVRAALYLTGADSPEALDGRLLEELESHLHRPLLINVASRARLLDSGLLSPYQVAALEEYRSRSGDVLSFAELERVDGFGKEAVAALRPFLSLASEHVPGEAVNDTLRFRHSAILRATWKDVGGKYRLTAGRFEGAVAARGEKGTVYALWRTRRGKIVLGDYNVRYGQGLAFWSAFQLAGLNTLDAFCKRAGGLAPSWSFSGEGTYRGLAWDWTSGPVQLALFATLDGRVGAHAGWLGRYGQAGVTASRDRISLDGKVGIRGVQLFGEAVWKGHAAAALGGCLYPLGDRFRGAVQIRGLPSAFSGKKNGEYAAALGLRFRSDDRTFTASWVSDAALLPVRDKDTGRKQVKSTGLLSWTCTENWLLESRFVLRWRNYEDDRTDFRADATWTRSVWTLKGRLNVVHDGRTGFLGYLEGGWKPPGGFCWLRVTAFSIPDWQSRIYCYERDAPGNFSAPAYHGTGLSLSAYGGWKKRFKRMSVRLYIRASGLWRKEKPGQAGLRIQLMADR